MINIHDKALMTLEGTNQNSNTIAQVKAPAKLTLALVSLNHKPRARYTTTSTQFRNLIDVHPPQIIQKALTMLHFVLYNKMPRIATDLEAICLAAATPAPSWGHRKLAQGQGKSTRQELATPKSKKMTWRQGLALQG
jgi:hypothetical protein